VKDPEGSAHPSAMTRSASLASGPFALALFTIAACECPDEHDDVGDEADEGELEVEDPWLLAIDEDETNIDALIRISVEPGAEGEVEVVCADLELPAGFDAETNFTSLAWHDDVLYASAGRATWGDTLVRIDPCACTVTEVGGYGFTLVSGLASTGDGLFGLTAEPDTLLAINPITALAKQRAALSDDWGSHGLTAMRPGDDLLYGLDATHDRLYGFDASDGALVESVAASEDFAAVGLEFHPGRGLFYACGLRDQGTALATIDRDTGLVEVVAESVFTTDCDNLAGPAGPIDCS
jgi:hypothetical protein